ncbi:hypothetical protein OGAPHI_005432 [Ogataea philodendri]|uniref:Protein HGH1 homolog n=1 Tax=Ogataea philodendri TaxID=1378263 RepID=A0A9P8NZ79_9ASCO|nr:uncharacterized protein OGAPHI_005432 [Ogataea philodendri]KAH3662184.1 hypothetical protein OGAPHI_005432 [Ogataea philodendri]
MVTELEEIREIALENLVQFSPSSQNPQLFKHNNSESIGDLKALTKEKAPQVVLNALTILANLCDDLEFRKLIVQDKEYLQFLLQQLVDLKNTNADLMCILLANLAKSDEIVQIFDLQVDLSKTDTQIFKSNQSMDCLMDLFVKGADRKLNRYATYDYLSYFFSDISRLPQGREYFVAEQAYDQVVPISKLLVFTDKYDSKTRREGVVYTIKNSLFDTNRHMTLLQDEKINLLPYVIGPFALAENRGLKDDEIFELPDELQLLDADKQIEPLADLLKTHLESVLLLCVTREGREYLRGKSVYPLIRELHKVAQDEKVQELCDKVVQMLMRDEPTEDNVEEMDQDSSSDDDQITEII